MDLLLATPGRASAPVSIATHFGGQTSPGESRGLESSAPNKHLTNEHRMIWITNLKNCKDFKKAIQRESFDLFLMGYSESPNWLLKNLLRDPNFLVRARFLGGNVPILG